ncbi:hypothetical protein ESA_01268 [Cronobacter sakazakii ATCC BAA-894]|uniref:Uncharacterized protein n=1 Tax=Cronobacter sakazakii (strain ATCC BAA-894) TaxID=290339 RepID=A7MP28_CROS8|nr:hypothetical protein ESA_01268 [Cronobacter sakazakii ATCC BAA-894]
MGGLEATFSKFGNCIDNDVEDFFVFTASKGMFFDQRFG